MENTVTSKWLHDHLDDDQLVIVDASQPTNPLGISPASTGCHIPGSMGLTVDEVSDPAADLPHMIPSPQHFEKTVRALGINNEHRIVVYDNIGIFFSPRIWWLFRIMGHTNIAVLDGGLESWISMNYTTVNKLAVPEKSGNFKANFDESQVITMDQVRNNITSNEFLLIDARSSGRFDGTALEPRKGMSSGHVPGSYSLPFSKLLDGPFMKSKDELNAIFRDFYNNKSVVFSCGSGVTACINLLAFTLTGRHAKIYDGSWVEWASNDNPIQKS